MPQDSRPLTNRSQQLNHRFETVRGQSDRLNHQSASLRNTRSFPMQKSAHAVQPSPEEENKVVMISANKPKMLHSWKEIAAYIGRGVRTVQRYEKTLGLPIRRLAGDDSSVSAFPDELDRWIQTAGTQPIGRTEWEKVMKEIEELRSEVAHLRKITEELNKKGNSDGVDGRSRKPRMENRSELSSAS